MILIYEHLVFISLITDCDRARSNLSLRPYVMCDLFKAVVERASVKLPTAEQLKQLEESGFIKKAKVMAIKVVKYWSNSFIPKCIFTIDSLFNSFFLVNFIFQQEIKKKDI